MKKKKRAVPAKAVVLPDNYTIETFQDPRWNVRNLALAKDPSSFNGTVSFRKYRVSVELMDEPKEVLIERIRELWKHCDNHHHWGPLKDAAASLGIELRHEDMVKRYG